MATDVPDAGIITFSRSAVEPGTGTTTPREQLNTVSSYLDAWAVYGGTPGRLEWLREGRSTATRATTAPGC